MHAVHTPIKRTLQLTSLVIALAFCANAQALDPTSSALVDSVTLLVPSEVKEDSEQPPVSYVGISGCQTNITSSNRVTATFNAAADVIFNETSGSNQRFVDAYVYSIDAGGGTVVCPGASCTTLSESEGEVSVGADTIKIDLAWDDFTSLNTTEDCADFEREYFIRVELRETGPDDSETVYHEAKVVIDTTRPTTVDPTGVVATEANIDVSWALPENVDDIQSYTIYWSKEQFVGGVLADSVSGLTKGSTLSSNDGTRTSGTTGVTLSQGETVWVSLVTRDETANESLLSTPVSSEVVQTLDFWEHYKQSGGAETGCNVAPGQSRNPFGLGFGALMLVSLIAMRRRKVHMLAALVAAGIWIGAPADVAAESPTYGTFELRMGTYYPSIDDEVSGDPFKDVFGSGELFYGELELGFFFYQNIGKAGLSTSIGYSSVSANAISDVEVNDETSFAIVPLRASIFYRFDYLAQNTQIPLMPVVKGGLDWVYWSVEGTDGETASFDGDEATGGKWGWHGSLALHLLLDIIDNSSAALFDLNWGVNNSYLFAEYMITRIDGFGAEGFDLSDNMWLFGLSFEY